MMGLEGCQVRDGRFVYDQRLESVLLALRHQPWIWSLRQRELAEAVLCSRLPKRGDAHIDCVCVLDCGSNEGSDTSITGDVPQKDVSIEQQPHYSKSRSTSSGSGSSKSSGTTNAPAAKPNRRGRPIVSTGRISATGRSLAVTTKVSPSMTRSRMPSGSRLTSSTVTFTEVIYQIQPRARLGAAEVSKLHSLIRHGDTHQT